MSDGGRGILAERRSHSIGKYDITVENKLLKINALIYIVYFYNFVSAFLNIF